MYNVAMGYYRYRSSGMEEAVGIGMIVGAVVGLIVALWMLWFLSDALQRVPPTHRKMHPGQVWLLLIPLFNLIWMFFVYTRIPQSFKSHFDSAGVTGMGDCGKGLGIATGILSLLGIVPVINLIVALPGLIVFIIYLVKIGGLKKRIVLDLTSAQALSRD
jgi:hypothetical protein